ncbi:MAG: pyridoxamine 5'-phosphate oxidase, partial [Gammaproteobacteria bacterium]|nr:pyridoxamine 5'-phosphate oxidase [Gammaproteobacteria bacterium]
SRALLDIMFEQVKSKFTQGEIPLPDFWGGYRIKADTLEFWQARDDRLHDCFFYQKNDDGQWITERLQP